MITACEWSHNVCTDGNIDEISLSIKVVINLTSGLASEVVQLQGSTSRTRPFLSMCLRVKSRGNNKGSNRVVQSLAL